MDEYVQKSDLNPFLVAYTISDDPTSDLIESLARRISKADDLNLFVIHIACDDFYEICSKYPSSKYPGFVFYRSQNPVFHVEYHGNYIYSELHSFLHTILLSPIKTLTNQRQLFSELQQISTNSSFVFYHNQEMENLSSTLQSYALTVGCSFYSFSAQSNVFEVYYSPFYHVKYKGPFEKQKMTDFIALNHYSIYHNYTYEDLFEYQPEKDIALVVSTREIVDDYFSILLNISSYFGSQFSYGYLNPFLDRRLNQTFQTFPEDPPYFTLIDRKTNHMFKLLQPLTYSNVKSFLLNVTKYKNQATYETQNNIIILVVTTILLLSIFVILHYHDQYQKLLSYLIQISSKNQISLPEQKPHQSIEKKKILKKDQTQFDTLQSQNQASHQSDKVSQNDILETQPIQMGEEMKQEIEGEKEDNTIDFNDQNIELNDKKKKKKKKKKIMTNPNMENSNVN